LQHRREQSVGIEVALQRRCESHAPARLFGAPVGGIDHRVKQEGLNRVELAIEMRREALRWRRRVMIGRSGAGMPATRWCDALRVSDAQEVRLLKDSLASQPTNLR
jgi:hypothetical protein